MLSKVVPALNWSTSRANARTCCCEFPRELFYRSTTSISLFVTQTDIMYSSHDFIPESWLISFIVIPSLQWNNYYSNKTLSLESVLIFQSLALKFLKCLRSNWGKVFKNYKKNCFSSVFVLNSSDAPVLYFWGNKLVTSFVTSPLPNVPLTTSAASCDAPLISEYSTHNSKIKQNIPIHCD